VDIAGINLDGIEDPLLRKVLEQIVGQLRKGSQPIQVGSILLSPLQPSLIKDPWIVCDGRAVSRVKYRELFQLVGTQWGDGDGSTSFNVPDMRDKFLYGTQVDIDERAGNTVALVYDNGDEDDELDRFYVTGAILGRA